MYALAFIIAVAAIIACFARPVYGLPLFIVAVICQCTHFLGHPLLWHG